MDESIQLALDFAMGPVIRAALALLVFGMLRILLLAAADIIGAYMTTTDRRAFWRKVNMHVWWFLAPGVVLRRTGRGGSNVMFVYHLMLCCCSLILRVGALILPLFMLAHMHLIELGFGVRWPALPGYVANLFAIVTIAAGGVLFLGRIYSPMVRRIEPPSSFIKPLIMILPFATGYAAMHPLALPIDYQVVLLLHVLSAAAVFIIIPFWRGWACLHARLAEVIPEAAWDAPADALSDSNTPAPNDMVRA